MAQRVSQVIDNKEPGYKLALSEAFGSPLEPASHPATFKLIDSVLKPLSQGLRRLDDGHSTHLIYPYIIDSHRLINAERHKQNGNVDSHLLAVSTKFIENIAPKQESEVAYAQTYYNLAGIFAYLLAKGMIEKEFPDMTKKEVHLRAAVKGTELAILSGLHSDCVYKMLEWLLRERQAEQSLINALLDENPNLDLMLSAVRTYVVSKSFHTGKAIQTGGTFSDARLVAEFSREVKASRDDVFWKFLPPASLSEAVERIMALELNNGMTDEFRRIEFHRLLTFAMDRANKTFLKNGTLGPDLRIYEKLVDFLLSNAFTHNYESTLFRTYITNYPVEEVHVDWPATEFGRSWETFLREAPFFQSREYRDLIERKFADAYQMVLDRKRDRYADMPEKWGEFLQYFGSGVALPEKVMSFSKDIGIRALDTMEKTIRLHTNNASVRGQFSSALRRAPISVQFEVTAEIQSRILSKISLRERLRIHRESGHLWLLPLPVVRTTLEQNDKFQEFEKVWKAFNQRASSGDTHARAVVESYTELVNDHWNNRAQYAIADLVQEDKTFWGWIGQIKGLTYAQTMDAIRKSVRELLEADPDVAPIGSEASYRNVLQVLAGEKASYTIEKEQVPWLDDSIRPLLQAKLKMGSTEANTARSVIDCALIACNPDLARDDYSKSLGNNMRLRKGEKITYGLIKDWHENALAAVFGPNFKDVFLSRSSSYLRLLVDQLVKRLPKSSLDLALKEIFLVDHPEGLQGGGSGVAWSAFERASAEDKNYFVELLIQRKLISGPSFILKQLLRSNKDEDDGGKKRTFYYSQVADLFPSLKTEAASASSFDEIRSLMHLLVPFRALETKKVGDDTRTEQKRLERRQVNIQSGQIIELKRIILERASRLDLTHSQAEDLFVRATANGPTQATDHWFYTKLWPSLRLNYRSYRSLRRYLGYKTDIRDSDNLSLIKSAVIRQEVAAHLLEPKIAQLAKQQEVDLRQLQALLSELDVYLPDRSLRKDDLLESLSFRLNIQDERVLKDLFEARKLVGASSHTTPVSAVLQSSVTQMLSDLDESARLELIAFMREPEDINKGLPQSLLNRIEDQILEAEFTKAQTSRGKDTAREAARRQTMKTKEEIESILRDSSPLERVIIYDLLITAGPHALNKNREYFSILVEKFLGIQATSFQSRALKTYVDLFPIEFRTVPLSYLLALMDGEGDGIVEVIKIFRAVGFQFSQVAPLFKIFDDETNRQMQRLKDNTMPLSHLEIVQEARKHLSPDDFDKIERFDHILASGSIKTVVLVKLKGVDRYAVLYLVNPNAAAQIDYNLDLSQNFIEGLRKLGIESSSPLFHLLIDGLRGRMKRELRMDFETELTALARSSVNQFLAEYGNLVPTEWRVQVARPERGTTVAKNAALYEYFNGKTLRNWREEISSGHVSDPAKIAILKQVEELVFRSAIFDFFRNAIFDPDRHVGNVLVDFESRTISFIDYGKLEDLREKSHGYDSRLIVARFLEGLNDLDADAIAESAILMSKSGHLDVSQRARLVTGLKQRLRELKKGQLVGSDEIHSLISLCAANGVNFEPKYLLGIFKGLLMLFGESYLDQSSAARLMRDEVGRLYKSKPVDLITFRAKNFLNRTRAALGWTNKEPIALKKASPLAPLSSNLTEGEPCEKILVKGLLK